MVNALGIEKQPAPRVGRAHFGLFLRVPNAQKEKPVLTHGYSKEFLWYLARALDTERGYRDEFYPKGFEKSNIF